MKAALRLEMLNVTAISDNVTEIYSPPVPAQAELNYITITGRISGNRLRNIQSAYSVNTETWQIDVYAKTDSDAETITKAIQDNFSFGGHETWDTVPVKRYEITSITDNTDLEMLGEQVTAYRRTIDMELKYEPQSPTR